MTKAGSTGCPVGPRSTGREGRAERLAAALKANLHRRKAQARDRAADAGRGGQPAEAHDSARVGADKRAT